MDRGEAVFTLAFQLALGAAATVLAALAVDSEPRSWVGYLAFAVVPIFLIGFGMLAALLHLNLDPKAMERNLDSAAAFGMALVGWAALPGYFALMAADENGSGRDFLSTYWYWALNPLPVDISAPIEWTPPIQPLRGWRYALSVVTQVSTVLLLLGGLGFAVRRFRRERALSR